MNKKVLTLCAGLFMASGFVNFASAEKLADFKGEVVKEVGGDAYFLLMQGTKDADALFAYGLTDEDGDGEYTEDVIQLGEKEDDVDLENIKNYTWFVEEETITVIENGKTSTRYVYALKNAASGKYLTFTDKGEIKWADEFDEAKAETYVVLPNYAQYTGAQTKLNPGNWASVDNDFLKLNGSSNTLTLASEGGNFALYSVKSADVTDDLLNKLYNSAGFNLKLNQDKWKDVENIFADQRVKAIEIKNNPVESKTANGYAFPEGIYFVTETPKGAYADADDEYDYLRGCTFIAVSPTENDINDAAQRAKGMGFALTLISGEELNTYVGEEGKKLNNDLVSEGAEISVYNACFKVAMQTDESIQLTLGNFRYQEKANAGTHKDAKDVLLNVTAKDGDDHGDLRLTTNNDPATTKAFIFKFEEAFSVKPTEFLNENAKAVYTIKFVSGEDKDEDVSEEGKYLYAPAYDSKNTMYAKGAEFVETSQPEAQWLITGVDGYNITFTNRANNDAEFTTKLYAEEDGAYSLAIKGGAGAAKFDVLNVDKDGNMSTSEEDVDLHQTWVELEQVSTDKFAGTWNVADETEVTMLFARDNTPTSNKLYVTFKQNSKGEVAEYEDELSVTSKLSEALQFQLVKTKDSVTILNGYSYKVGDVVKYTDRRDTVAFYTYKLQAFHDGVAVKDDKSGKDMFLGGYSNNKYKLTTNGADFIIKENVDGSVSILNTAKDYAEEQFVAIEDWKGEKNTKNESFIEYYEGSDIAKGNLTEEVGANYVKTYLRIEAPEVSLDTDKSYVQIKSEVGGTYLSKNDENDAIMAAAAEAPMTIRVFATDTKKVVPSFYIATDWNEKGERMFLFNPEDSVNYYVAEGEYNKKYQWNDKIGDDYATKVIFKQAYLDESLANLDTLSTEVKGEKTLVADVADDNQKVQGGLDKFKFQIVLAENEEDLYWIRQNGQYLRSINGKLTLSGDRAEALKVEVIDTDAPTANESINAASEAVQVVAANGAVIVKGAEGKNVVVSTILGKVVANEVLNSDNETIAAPAGIVVVSVDGESFKVAVK